MKVSLVTTIVKDVDCRFVYTKDQHNRFNVDLHICPQKTKDLN